MPSGEIMSIEISSFETSVRIVRRRRRSRTRNRWSAGRERSDSRRAVRNRYGPGATHPWGHPSDPSRRDSSDWFVRNEGFLSLIQRGWRRATWVSPLFDADGGYGWGNGGAGWVNARYVSVRLGQF